MRTHGRRGASARRELLCVDDDAPTRLLGQERSSPAAAASSSATITPPLRAGAVSLGRSFESCSRRSQSLIDGVELDAERVRDLRRAHLLDGRAPTLAMPECNAACNIDPTDDPTDGMIGEPPTASIFHPGDAEERKVDVPIPFIGEAVDPEDGPLGGTSLVWESDLEGLLGDGGMFDKALT
jgi:hypothetical protein